MKPTKIENFRIWLALRILPFSCRLRLLELLTIMKAASSAGFLFYGSSEEAASRLIHLREDQVIKEKIKEEEIN